MSGDRVEELAACCGWSSADLDACCVDWFGKTYRAIAGSERYLLWKSLTTLYPFVIWREKRRAAE